MTTNLREKYNLPYFGIQLLRERYTTAQARDKYKGYFAWMDGLKATDAEAMSVNELAVAWNNEVWITDGYQAGNAQSAYPANGCQSRQNITCDIYYAAVQIPLLLAFGIYEGGGTGNFTETTTANGGPGTTAGSRIDVDHTNWLSRLFPGRNPMQSASWGDETNYGYSESFIVRGFRLEGGMVNKVHDPSFESSGIAIWDSGETSRVEHCFASGFNDSGFRNVRGTPSIFFGCSAFSNRKFGFWIDGSSLGTIALYSPSGDDNGPGDGTPGALIGGYSGHGRPGGGNLSVFSTKGETDNVQGRMHGAQRLFDLTGFWNLVYTGGQVFSSATRLAEAIAIDFQTFKGSLDVRGLNLINFAAVAKITSNGKTVTYPSPGDNTPMSFVLTEEGLCWSSRKLGQATPLPNPQPTPQPTPEPAPTPGAAKVLYELEGPVTVNATSYQAIDVDGVTRVRLSLRPNSIGWGRILGTGSNQPSLMVYPDGLVYYDNAKLTDTPLVVGVVSVLDITLPQPVHFTALFQTDKGQGGAQQGVYDYISLY